MNQETGVIIVGTGPAGLAVSACLNLEGIPNIVLEREDGCASLWKKRCYERLKLHLAKSYCELPHMSFPSDAPTFISKKGFVDYLENYESKFNVRPLYGWNVVSASLSDKVFEKWHVVATNKKDDNEVIEEYFARLLVVATGENGHGFVPEIPGLHGFSGEVMHSSQYENGKKFAGKNVLVVGSGNSGMEIAFDLSNWGARTSIVARSPVQVLTEEMVQLGMMLLKYVPCKIVDNVVVMLSTLKNGV